MYGATANWPISRKTAILRSEHVVTLNRKWCNFLANRSDQSGTVLQIQLEVTMQMVERQGKGEIRLSASGLMFLFLLPNRLSSCWFDWSGKLSSSGRSMSFTRVSSDGRWDIVKTKTHGNPAYTHWFRNTVNPLTTAGEISVKRKYTGTQHTRTGLQTPSDYCRWDIGKMKIHGNPAYTHWFTNTLWLLQVRYR